MENPINGSTVLKYPVPDAEVRNHTTCTDGGGGGKGGGGEREKENVALVKSM
jgi:hypothetical protein